jgi:hypothetical protein
VYAITFPEKAQLKEYQTRIEEAKRRDHRVVGVQQELFFFHPLSPGSCFFLPLGARVYNGLIGYMREKYWEYEYEEVRDGGGERRGEEEEGAAPPRCKTTTTQGGQKKRRRRRRRQNQQKKTRPNLATPPNHPTKTSTGRVAQRVQL